MIINTTTARTFLEAVHGITNTLDLIQALQGLSRQLDETALARLAECITGKDTADYADIKEELKDTAENLELKTQECKDFIYDINELEKDVFNLEQSYTELQSEFDEYRARTGHSLGPQPRATA